MSLWRSNTRARDALAQAAAISKSQAVIEFNMDGTIVTANQNFLDAMGYRLEEIAGKHHAIFMPGAMRESPEYRAFWADLNLGKYKAGEFKRVGKGDREVWIQASYNPILDASGKPVKVIKFASDITSQKIRNMEAAGKIAAIGRAQAVIEFNLDGTIIVANENFLGALGYSLTEIQGKHHSMFVAPSERDSSAYREFWATLNRGEFRSGEYKRFGKGGKEIWILASYNPILDDTGKPFKVVKFASDVTAEKLRAADFAGQIEAIGKSQAVIEFNMDGIVLNANENFLVTLGYSLVGYPGQASFDVHAGGRAGWPCLSRVLGDVEPRRVSIGRIQARRQGRQGGLDPGILQPDPRSQQQTLQGGEIRHRHDRPGGRTDEG